MGVQDLYDDAIRIVPHHHTFQRHERMTILSFHAKHRLYSRHEGVGESKRLLRPVLGHPMPKATPTSPTPRVMIDHTAFPHIIDSILSYATNEALMAFRAVSFEYYDRICHNLARRLVIQPGVADGKRRQTIATSRGEKVFLLRPTVSATPMPRSFHFRRIMGGDKDRFDPCFARPNLSPARYGKIKPLLGYTNVIDVDSRRVRPAHLADIKALLPLHGGVHVSMLRLLNLGGQGWGDVCPIVPRTLVIFAMDMYKCPPQVPGRFHPDDACLVPRGTRRVVLNISAQHMVSIANIQALLNLPSSVTELVIHLIDTAHMEITCSHHSEMRYSFIAVLIVDALRRDRNVIVVKEESALVNVEAHIDVLQVNSAPDPTERTPTVAQPAASTTSGPRPASSTHKPPALDKASHAIATFLHQTVIYNRGNDADANRLLRRVRFLSTAAYIKLIGRNEWLWEARP